MGSASNPNPFPFVNITVSHTANSHLTVLFLPVLSLNNSH